MLTLFNIPGNVLETRRGHSQHQTSSSKNEKDAEMAEVRSKKEQIVEPVFFSNQDSVHIFRRFLSVKKIYIYISAHIKVATAKSCLSSSSISLC